MKKTRKSLKKKQILRGFQAFSRVISKGQSIRRNPLRAFFLVEHGRSRLQAGFAAGRNLRGAVQRNRARRWMKEAFRINSKILDPSVPHADQTVNIVFMLSTRGSTVLRHTVRDEIHQAMVFLLHDLAQRIAETP